MKFQTTSMRFWYVNTTTISYMLDGKEGDEDIKLEYNLETPRDWSYHCGDITFTNTNASVELYFYDFQVYELWHEDSWCGGKK